MERAAFGLALALLLGGVVYAGGVYWWQQRTEVSAAIPQYPLLSKAQGQSLVFFKQPECGCCDEWLRHAGQSGFAMSTEAIATLEQVVEHKRSLGVPDDLHACHTSYTPDKRYVFEGHVPAAAIADFLQVPVAGAYGLVVPGMPIGSPGMEIGDRFMAYEVLLLMTDGSRPVYRAYSDYESQFEYQ